MRVQIMCLCVYIYIYICVVICYNDTHLSGGWAVEPWISMNLIETFPATWCGGLLPQKELASEMGPFYPRKWDNIRDTSPEKKHMQLPFVATSYYIYIYILYIYIYIQIYMYIYICMLHTYKYMYYIHPHHPHIPRIWFFINLSGQLGGLQAPTCCNLPVDRFVLWERKADSGVRSCNGAWQWKGHPV